METQASRLKKAKSVYPEILVKVGKKKTIVTDEDIACAIYLAHKNYMEAKDPTTQLKQVKVPLVIFARKYLKGHGTVHLQAGLTKIKIVFGSEAAIREENLKPLRKILMKSGSEPDDLIRKKTNYTASQELVDLACDADSDLAKLIRPYIDVRDKSPQFTFSKAEDKA